MARKDQLIQDIINALRIQSGLTVLFHAAIAEKLGLHATDHKTLDILRQRGRMTAGELAHETGLTSGAITGVIDRLEKVGYVARVSDKADRRRVFVEPKTDKAMKDFGPIFMAIAGETSRLCEGYDANQLSTILNFLTRSNDMVGTLTANFRNSREKKT